MRARGKKKVLTILVVFLAAVFVYFAHRHRLYDRLLFSLHERQRAAEWKGKSLWLSDYQVVTDAAGIPGIEKNLSGLTWNRETGTLFSIINSPPQIAELSTSGELLRLIRLNGIVDPEAIEYIGEGRYIVADERTQKVICVGIDEDTTEIDAEGLERLTLGLGEESNKGIEGLAWDFANRKLYAAKERDPVVIYEIVGFPSEPSTVAEIRVSKDRERDRRLFVSDLSSLDYNDRYQHLLVLSDESRLLIEIDREGHPVSSLSLIIGHGLGRPVPQAEGIAMDDHDNLYLVSEPNLFYVFQKKTGG